jgi:hypothetical protein
MLTNCLFLITLWHLSRMQYFGLGVVLFGAFKPFVSTIVVINTSFVFTTSLL